MGTERKALGRGLDHLLGRSSVHLEVDEPSPSNRILKVGIEKISPNPHQPRKYFEESKLQELATSIKEQGLIQPIVVRRGPQGSFYIIAGERRWRAVQKLGWENIPIYIKEDSVTEESQAVLALVENLQRENLNPMEEAKAYRDILNQAHLTQKDLAQKVGKDRSTIANSIRLLELHPEAQNLLEQNKISLSIAKLLLQEKSKERQKILARQAFYEKWTVREVEKKVQNNLFPRKSQPKKELPSWLHEGLEKMAQKWNLDVSLTSSSQKSKLVISFSDPNQLADFIDHV